MFQFPSSGKGCSKEKVFRIYTFPPHWFQFPSSGKGCSKFLGVTGPLTGRKMFQFPSSGKGCSKIGEHIELTDDQRVSIPFKREGVFKVVADTSEEERDECFNSLQAGRGVQRDFPDKSNGRGGSFQFPSSGKGCSKVHYHGNVYRINGMFQFPSSGKGCSKEAVSRGEDVLAFF